MEEISAAFAGIETKFKKQYYPVLVAVTNVAELLVVEYTEEGIRFGSSVTLSTLDNTLKEAVRKMSGTVKFNAVNAKYLNL